MMIPKKTINEIRNRLRLEKNIMEIYVEGTFDRDLYTWVLEKMGLSGIKIYPISTVQVDSDLLKKHNLTTGDRQRVVAFSKEIENNKEIHPQVLLIIDADFDYIFDRVDYKSPLISTTGTSAEMLLWQRDVLVKFFRMALGEEMSEDFSEKIMNYVEPIAKDIFLFRAAKESIGADWKLLEMDSCIEKDGNFCFLNYCNKTGDKNGNRHLINSQVEPIISNLKQKSASEDIHRKIHGHDTFAILCKRLKILGKKSSITLDPDVLGRVLMTSLEWGHVSNDPIIDKLKKHFGPIFPKRHLSD